MNDWAWLLGAIAGFLVWLAQKRVEMKMKVFDEAVTALLRYQTEATDQNIQNEQYRLTERVQRGIPYLSNETSVLMLRSTALVSEFFSQDVSQSFSEAMNSVHLGRPSPQMGGPVVKGYLSIPEIEKIIKDLSKELTIHYVLKTWMLRVVNSWRHLVVFVRPIIPNKLK